MFDIEETGFIDIEVIGFIQQPLPYKSSDPIGDHIKKLAKEKYGEMKSIGNWRVMHQFGMRRVWFNFTRYNEYDILCQCWEHLLEVRI